MQADKGLQNVALQLRIQKQKMSELDGKIDAHLLYAQMKLDQAKERLVLETVAIEVRSILQAPALLPYIFLYIAGTHE